MAGDGVSGGKGRGRGALEEKESAQVRLGHVQIAVRWRGAETGGQTGSGEAAPDRPGQ